LPPEEEGATVIIAVCPLIEHLSRVADSYETGAEVVIPRQPSIPSRFLDPKAKTRTRLHYELANRQAARLQPGAWAVLLDEHGYLTEGTSCNFFIVARGELLTPPAHDILRGVSRGHIFELADELGLPCRESNLEPYDVLQADEAFLTASSFCLLPVTRFEGRAVGDGQVGPITRRLLNAWSAEVGVDIPLQARQVRDRWDS
jgi:branched-chain amino acid aminotransferase